MEQNREPRNKPKSLWSINIQKGVRSIKWNQNSPSTNGVGITGLVHAKKKKKETRPLTYTIHQNKLKMDKGLKYKL